MATDRFPYDLPSREALVTLIQQSRPAWGIESHTVDFDPPYYSPTVETPGRTFIEVYMLDKGIKTWFRYRRLDISKAIGERIIISIEGDITSRKIVEKINSRRAMVFGVDDVYMTDRVLGSADTALLYRMRAKANSAVWYGSTIIEVVPANQVANARLAEDGSTRITEDGETRTLEAA
jgi:hypothetical protein